MFLIDRDNKKLIKINETTFSENGFQERYDIQEWIANNPECLDEELLIIQKEFAGFDETKERLDLLALDRSGALVIIENKRDDSGKDVTWQALKYVSYCSTLTREQIIRIYQDHLDQQENGEKAADKLSDFFGRFEEYRNKTIEDIRLNKEQKIILVAGDFRKEVTSTVMWLINRGIDVRCFKATPYEHKKEYLLDIEQIIPVKEAADYYIRVADKNKESQSIKEADFKRGKLRKRYWEELLKQYASVVETNNFENINATTENWIACGSGVAGVTFAFVFTTKRAGVELGINYGTKDVNDAIYKYLYDRKDEIEKDFEDELIWSNSDVNKTSSIGCYSDKASIADEDTWQKAKDFHCKKMPLLDAALRAMVNEAVKQLQPSKSQKMRNDA